jgi:hypothetical protein
VNFEQRSRELNLEIPDFNVTPYTGPNYGTMKSHHQVGSLLFLGGHVPEYPDGTLLHPGRAGETVTVEQATEAARLTAMNCLAGMRYALGDLNRVKAIVRSLNRSISWCAYRTSTRWGRSRTARPMSFATSSVRSAESADERPRVLSASRRTCALKTG